MSPSPQLAPAGSSVYASDTMYVGDGTWDSSRNTFLLPNLVGLNFDTMRYNGMANRFRDMPQYHNLILGHGVVSAITFLLIVPLAIFIAKFYYRNPARALRLHIWLQILAIGLTTVTIILGFAAVGPSRRFTNPHHGIGLAIYVMVLLQAIGGWLIHRTERDKERSRIPLKLMLHQWLGRAIAILGFVQIPLGLTLYGSPEYLFILYAVYGALLLFVLFALLYKYRPRTFIEDGGSYVTYSRTDATGATGDDRGRGHRLGKLAALGAAGAGIAALARKRSRSRSRRRSRDGSRTDVVSSRRTGSRPSGSSFVDEKYPEDHRNHPWRDRFLGAAAGLGAVAALRRLFGGRRREDQLSDVSTDYYPPASGTHRMSETDLSRVEQGQAPASPGDHWRRVEEREAAQVGGSGAITPAAAAAAAAAAASPSRRSRVRRRRSGDSVDSYDSRDSLDYEDEPPPGGGHGFRNTLAGLGAMGFLRHKFNERRNRKEQRRVEEFRRRDLENERIHRRNSRRKRFTGDGHAPPSRHGYPDTGSSVGITGSNPALSRHSIPPVPGTAPTGSRTDMSGPGAPSAEPIPMPPPVTDPNAPYESASEAYSSADGGHRRRHRHHSRDFSPGVGPSTAAGGPSGHRHRSASRQRSSVGDGSVTSPPVSVKVKMHNDGRHVTLRRLNREEAAAAREQRRRERPSRSGGRRGSLSSASGDDRWRRGEAAPPPPPAAGPPPVPPGAQLPGPSPGPPPQPTYDLPPPPPIPASQAGGGGSVGSPGTVTGTGGYDTGTDMSRAETNRRRRRAERAQARQGRTGGSRVEFT
ncbi:hypothetical protein BDY21DRAFT_397420 [Lineolata rhizophorae]|uniref:Cytochrome b561 domain-containing protein n=1 Tax=Lineolata rhizophorae TaxID=578093 RepID=A0A6A6PBK7_9PEZI|nr:hypothetical protein BDY21DRAFT_397420 [Lineolata rhizophorae]